MECGRLVFIVQLLLLGSALGNLRHGRNGPTEEIFSGGAETFKVIRHLPHLQHQAQLQQAQPQTTVRPLDPFPVQSSAGIVSQRNAPPSAPAFAPIPLEQHDAQVFVRRPPLAQAPVVPAVSSVPAAALTQQQQPAVAGLKDDFQQFQPSSQQFQPSSQQFQPSSQQFQPSSQQFQQSSQQFQPSSQQFQQSSQQFQQSSQQFQQSSQQFQPSSQQFQQSRQQFQPNNEQFQQSRQQFQPNNEQFPREFQKLSQQLPQPSAQQQVPVGRMAPPLQPANDEDFEDLFIARTTVRPKTPKVHRGRARHQQDDSLRQLPVVPEQPRPAVIPTTAAPLLAAPIRVADTAEAPQQDNPVEAELFREQAQNAHYEFASAVDDKLTDNSQVRQETRDGLNLSGLYSYSDGFFRRTVHYEADENGYRVTKEEVEPIGNGPQPDPAGSARVQAKISGQDFGYRITADDIREREKTPAVVAAADNEQQLLRGRSA